MPGLPPNSLFSALAFTGFLLACAPLPRHVQCASWNIGICMYMLWTALGCLMFFVHSILWADNVLNSAPVWCDISARFLLASSVGIPASSLCITRRLYYITKLQTISVGEKRRREVMVDLSIGIGLPCIVMALQYVIQGCRFVLFERIGCYPCNVNTLATYLLIYVWTPMISLTSLVYAALTLRRAFLRQEKLRRMLSTGYHLDSGRYWRPMALCCSEIIIGFPLSFYNIIVNTIITPIEPFVSWASIHSNISQVEQISVADWQSDPIVAVSLEFSRWMFVSSAFMIFAFFGLAPEARQFYRETFLSFSRHLGYAKPAAPLLLGGVSKQEWRLTYAGRSTPPVHAHDADQKIVTKRLSVPDQARVKDYSQSSLSSETPPYRESWTLSSSLRVSEDEKSAGNPPGLSASGIYHSRISCETIPVIPDPAFDGDLEIPSEDIGRAF